MELEQGTLVLEGARPTCRLRTRVQHARGRLHKALLLLAAATDDGFVVPELATLAGLTLDKYSGMKSALAAAVGRVLTHEGQPDGSDPKPVVLDIDTQLTNFARFQAQHGIYFQWSPEAMAVLRQKLVELGSDVELVPCFAMSVGVKLPDGRYFLLDRRGIQVKS
jgi:hypothetical protein